MAAAVQMLSSRLYVISRPLSSLVHASYASSACPLCIGLQVDAVRLAAAVGSLPFRTASIERFCRASSGTTDEASPDLKDVNGYYGDKAIQGLDSSKFQHNDYGRKEVVEPGKSKHYLNLTDKELFAQCKMDTYRASGPGGQHRNKTDSAVRLKHIPTGLVTQAGEDRSQHNNRALALGRMRQLIASEVREKVELEGYKPPLEVVRILPHEKGVKKDRSVQKIGPNHPEFAQGVKGLLDLLEAVGGSVSDAASALGLTTGALSKLITSDKVLWQGANRIRASKGLKPLR